MRAIAHRVLGSYSDADDVVQEAWLRYSRSAAEDIESLGAWLTTVVTRLCLNVLRARSTRKETAWEVLVPDPVVDLMVHPVVDPAAGQPEEVALVADAVGSALATVLHTLPPPERLAYVLHDVFAIPFPEIAAVVDRSPEAARQLASRARRRLRAAAPVPDVGLGAQRRVVEAFFAAARGGRFDDLVAVLAPGVELHVDAGPVAPGPAVVAGAEDVARRALLFADPRRRVVPAVVDGAAGVVIVDEHGPTSVMGFTVTGGVVAAIHVLADPGRLALLRLDRILGTSG